MKGNLEKALQYHNAGLKIIPHWNFSTFAENWKQYVDLQTEDDVRSLFSRPCTGIAMLCTDGIEVIDVDVKHDPVGMHMEYFDYLNLYDPDILQKAVVIQRTKSDGYHLIYRTHLSEGNQKLARVAGHTEAYLETRGKGGLLFVDPSPGYCVKRGSLLQIPTVTDRFRKLLIKCARELDQHEKKEAKPEVEPMPTLKQETKNSTPITGTTPWQDYDEKHEVVDLLQNAGWTIANQRGGITRMTRPDGTNGNVHGTVLKSREGKDVFYPFSTSTEFEPEKCYGPFGVYSVLHHSGDYSAAAKELYRQGYGDRYEEKNQVEQSEPAKQESPANLDDLIKKAESYKYDYNKPPKVIDYIFQYNADGKGHPIAGAGMIGAIVGKQKSMKSTLITAVEAAAISGREYIGFSFDLKDKVVLSFDTEQPEYYFHQQRKAVHRLSGIYNNVNNYRAYRLRDFSKEDRIKVIDYYIKMTDNVGLIVIDGLIDLCKDFNDNKEAEKLMQQVMSWTDQSGALCLCVLHLTKGQGFMRGHLGTELQNKCDFSIETELQDDGFAKVYHRDARTPRFPQFEFTRNQDGFPVRNHNEQIDTSPIVLSDNVNVSASARPGDDEDVPF